LRRFTELATNQAAGGAAATQATGVPITAPPPPKARAPVGEIIPPSREGRGLSPATRLAEANRHVRSSVREAQSIIQQSGRLFVREHVGTGDPGAAAQRVNEDAVVGVGRTGQSVQEAIALAMGQAPAKTSPEANPESSRPQPQDTPGAAAATEGSR
jgi:hypothetical protein